LPADRRERVLVAREQHLRLADELLLRRKLEVPRFERLEPRRRGIRPRRRNHRHGLDRLVRRRQQCAAGQPTCRNAKVDRLERCGTELAAHSW
jgi:hypothetical protein